MWVAASVTDCQPKGMRAWLNCFGNPDDRLGAGGQNVNKVSSAIHLRFDINASSLPELYKQRLLKLQDRRISKEGVINSWCVRKHHPNWLVADDS